MRRITFKNIGVLLSLENTSIVIKYNFDFRFVRRIRYFFG